MQLAAASCSPLGSPALFVGVASAADCGPDKLGTSRIAEVGTQGGLQVGLKTYPQAIPLADHEVILTFDDGPDAATTPQVLKALADRMRARDLLRDRPQCRGAARTCAARGRRRAITSPITPTPIRSRPCATWAIATARADILKGMIAVEKIVYGAISAPASRRTSRSLKLHAPFFRFPGFADTADLRAWFAANNVGIFGIDLWASDWIEMTPQIRS